MSITVFWPTDLYEEGYCYGWSNPSVCVVGVLQADNIFQAIAKLRSVGLSPQNQQWKQHAGDPLEILGRCCFKSSSSNNHPLPSIELVEKHLCGRLPQDVVVNFIYYIRHKIGSSRFYRLDSVNFRSSRINHGVQLSPTEMEVHDSVLNRDFTRHLRRSSPERVLLRQWNAAIHLQHITSQQSRSPISTTSLIIKRLFRPLFRRFSQQVVSNPTGFCAKVGSFTRKYATFLRDRSATVRQLVTRAEILCHLFTLGVPQGCSNHLLPGPANEYIQFYNAVWIILNDIIIGVAFGTFLRENNADIANEGAHLIEIVLIEWLQSTIVWLDSWPAGLKLNTELSRFCSHNFIGLIKLWIRVYRRILPYLPTVVYALGVASCFGVTLATSFASDLLCAFTVHIHICYLVVSTVYRHQFQLAGSLWNLFHGRRFNALRNRTDPWDYDIDQLLLGTIVFTLITFLFPTVLVYYILFSLLRFSIVIYHVSSETVLDVINHFPLFALMLRGKDPWRISGGICIVHRPENESAPVVVAQPLQTKLIFAHYSELWKYLVEYYHPSRLAIQFLTGSPLVVMRRED